MLVVDDDPIVRDVLLRYLARDGLSAEAAADGPTAVAAFKARRPDLVVLDLMLPRLDGFEVFRRIRRLDPRSAVIMLTARGQEIDRVIGLESGADDYVAKPFSPRELVARVKAILRRTEGVKRDADVLVAGEVEIDTGRREVRCGAEVVPLAAREFDLLQYLAEHVGLALSRRQLLDGVWGADWYGDDRTVDVHVRQLRKKLGDALPLTTVWGIGYRLD